MKCEYRIYQKNYRQRMKDAKRCVNCGKQDDRTLAGHIRCKVCSDRESEYWKTYYKKKNGISKPIVSIVSTMDEINRRVKMAEKLGMSYGEYVRKIEG